jgi:hypothetical protein
MNLDASKLENVRVRGNRITARCPACAEVGRDRRGDHLVVNEDGRFACVVYAGDAPASKAHRKRIFALCGGRDVKTLKVRPTLDETTTPLKTGLLGRLGRVFETHAQERGGKNVEQGRDPHSESELIDPERTVLGVLKPNAPLKPYRPLTEHERDVLRRNGMENDPLVIEALNIFDGNVVG